MKKTWFMMTAVLLLAASCKKNVSNDIPLADNARFPETDAEREIVNINKEVAQILETVYQDPRAYYEVSAAIYSEFYDDERVLLKDLLFPETSDLYTSERFLKLRAERGVFRKIFLETLNKGNFPSLKSKLKNSTGGMTNENGFPEPPSIVVPDPSLDIFSGSTGVAIYFPYSENFGTSFNQLYFDNINKKPTGPTATIVAADREADSGPGQEPYVCGTAITRRLCFRTVTVNDSYAEGKATHIVSNGAEPAIPAGTHGVAQVYLVYIGEVKCNKQYDRLISFNGSLQCGGPDLRFCRGDAYLTLNADQQIVSPQNTISVNLKRKDVRNGGRWKTVNALWDSNWEPDNLNQVFAIYEEDRTGTSTMNATLSTTVTLQQSPVNITGTRQVGFSFVFKTQDEIIRQLMWNRESFFQYNKGGLNNGCGTRNGWTVYDCNVNVAYTMPTQ